MYTGFESMIGLAFLFGIFSLFVSIAFFVLIAVVIVRLVGGRSGGQPSATPGAQPNRSLLVQLLTFAALAQGRPSGAGPAGGAGLGARQDAINAGFDPTSKS
jgi:uncharacterized membrane protein YphA (DoxX/SURF4 family)